MPAPAKTPSGTKRHPKIRKDPLSGISKPAIRRLARRAGVKRIAHDVFDEVRKEMKRFLTATIKDAITYAEYEKRKTVKSSDVVRAMRNNGGNLYGIDFM